MTHVLRSGRADAESGRVTTSIIAPVVLVLLIVGLFGPIYLSSTQSDWFQDIHWHVNRALEFRESGSFDGSPHFLYHLGVIAVSYIAPDAPLWVLGGVPILFSNVALGLTIYGLAMSAQRPFSQRVSPWLMVGFVVIILTITPIIVEDGSSLYLVGYFNPTPYHNPTHFALKMWVIPVSLLAWRAIEPRPYASKRAHVLNIVAAAALVFISTSAKPNYTLALLPGLVICALGQSVRRRAPDWPLLIFGFVIPAVAILLAQYAYTFSDSNNASVSIGLLTVIRHYVTSRRWIPIMFLASVAFPAAVYVLYFWQALRDAYLNLSWAVFLSGAALAYFFHETGERMYHANFLWSGHITIFVLMFASLAFYLRHGWPANDQRVRVFAIRSLLVLLILALHVLFGLFFWVAFVHQALGA